MHTQTIIAPITNPAIGRAPVPPSADQFSVIASCLGVIATEFTYRKEEEIYGEDEPSEYVYQVVRGAVRTYKLLSDGRRQIGAFHLAGDVFGLDPGYTHRLTAEAITDTTVRLVKRRSLEAAAASNVQVAHNLWTMTAGDLQACRRSHAASRPKDRARARSHIPAGNGPSARQSRDDGAADVPPRYR